MSGKRGHGRLDRAERAATERGLDKSRSTRKMARDLGRSPSSAADEARRKPRRLARAGQGRARRVGAREGLRQARAVAPRVQRPQQAPLPLLDAVQTRVLRREGAGPGRRPPGREPLQGGARAHHGGGAGRSGPRPVSGADPPGAEAGGNEAPGSFRAPFWRAMTGLRHFRPSVQAMSNASGLPSSTRPGETPAARRCGAARRAARCCRPVIARQKGRVFPPESPGARRTSRPDAFRGHRGQGSGRCTADTGDRAAGAGRDGGGRSRGGTDAGERDRMAGGGWTEPVPARTNRAAGTTEPAMYQLRA